MKTFKEYTNEDKVEEIRNYRKEYDNYHAQPEQRERNAARLRARRLMVKSGKVEKFDKMDVHHKDNNPLNNEKNNLAVTTQTWNRTEPRLRKESIRKVDEDPVRKITTGPHAGRWMVKYIHNRRKATGVFDDKNDAIKHAQVIRKMKGAKLDEAVGKFMTGEVGIKGKRVKVEVEVSGVDNKKRIYHAKVLAPKEHFGLELQIPAKVMHRGKWIKTETGKAFKDK